MVCFVNDGERLKYLTISDLWECQKKMPFHFTSLQLYKNPSNEFLPFIYQIVIKNSSLASNRKENPTVVEFNKIKIQRLNCEDSTEKILLDNNEEKYKIAMDEEANKVIGIIENVKKSKVVYIEILFVINNTNSLYELWLVGCKDIYLENNKSIKNQPHNKHSKRIDEKNYLEELMNNLLAYGPRSNSYEMRLNTSQKPKLQKRKLTAYKHIRTPLAFTDTLTPLLTVKGIGDKLRIPPQKRKRLKLTEIHSESTSKVNDPKEINVNPIICSPILFYRTTYSSIKKNVKKNSIITKKHARIHSSSQPDRNLIDSSLKITKLEKLHIESTFATKRQSVDIPIRNTSINLRVNTANSKENSIAKITRPVFSITVKRSITKSRAVNLYKQFQFEEI